MTDDALQIPRQERPLRASLAALADADRALEASPRIEAALLDAWDATHRPPARRGGVRYGWWLLPAAAALLFAFADALRDAGDRLVPARPATVVLGDRRLEAPPTLATEGGGIHPIPAPHRGQEEPVPLSAAETQAGYRDELQTVALVGGPFVSGEPLRLLRMRVDWDTLASMGLRSLSSPDATMVDIEMLVSEDGVARGLRVEE